MPVSSRNPGVLTGSIHLFAMVAGQAGYSLCDGGMLSPAAEPRLFAVIGTTYGGDGVTTFAKPQICGEFVRGLDMGRGVDAGRLIGSFQASEVGQHTHNYGSVGGAGFSGPIEAVYPGAVIATQMSEARPRSVAFPYCIKL